MSVRVKCTVEQVLQWPSDAFSIDHFDDQNKPAAPHTILLFVPGNPGLVDWYVPSFQKLIGQLGPGFCVRGVSYAGHSLGASRLQVAKWAGLRDTDVPWTIDGQCRHKIAYIDMMLEQLGKDFGQRVAQTVRIVFVSHSIGAHLTQRLLVHRLDLLQRTLLVIHLMPLIRMDAPYWRQQFLDFAANHPEFTIAWHRGMMQNLQLLPTRTLAFSLRTMMGDAEARHITAQLVRQPEFATNFFTLGLEEIRKVPRTCDVSSLRWIGRHVPTRMLACAKDHWFPEEHVNHLKSLQQRGILPWNIDIAYEPKMKHDYICHPEQADKVVNLCEAWIRETNVTKWPRSRL